ncbi:MAG: DUF2478 domain-containing protein [Beijerinckiaceae bacterium]|jgi:nucleoside-triphosphatase THEP1|nr:DUF2478 domain-containing protein [Beijerinckiaceae bacterium]
MSRSHESPEPALLALVYTDAAGADRVLTRLAMALLEQDVSLAGLVQHNAPRPGRSRCDMVLEDLGSGRHVAISQDRGPEARGCMLDVSQLLTASLLVEESLAQEPELVILNKFGKSESEGGGFRPLISTVIGSGMPLVIAVPWRNIESWRAFAGGMGQEIALEGEAETVAGLLAILGYGQAAAAGTGMEPRGSGL